MWKNWWPLKRPGFEREREVRVLLMLQASTIAASQQAHLLGFALRRRLLLGQQNCLDVGQHTTLSNGHSLEQLVQLFVVSDGQLQVSGNDSPFVIVSGSVSCQLQDFSSQVLQHSCKVDWGTSSNSLSVVSFADASVDSSNGELQTSSAWSCLWGFSSNFAALWFSSCARHCLLVWSSLSIVFWLDEMIDFRSLLPANLNFHIQRARSFWQLETSGPIRFEIIKLLSAGSQPNCEKVVESKRNPNRGDFFHFHLHITFKNLHDFKSSWRLVRNATRHTMLSSTSNFVRSTKSQ